MFRNNVQQRSTRSKSFETVGRRACYWHFQRNRVAWHRGWGHSYQVRVRVSVCLVVHGDSPRTNTGRGCHALLQGIFPTQGLDPGLPRCRWTLHCRSRQKSQVHVWDSFKPWLRVRLRWEIDGETVETVSDFILGGSKITANGDCSHEIKRHSLEGKL